MKKVILSSLLLSSLIFADDSVDYTFNSGEVIKASEINANFSKLSTLITELRGQIESTKTQIATKQLVGFTPSTMAANSGVIAMNQACNQAYADSMMCTSEDILNSTTVIGGSDIGWVKPALILSDSTTINVIFAHSSGKNSCKNWTTTYYGATEYDRGVATDGSGKMILSPCNSDNKVACCK